MGAYEEVLLAPQLPPILYSVLAAHQVAFHFRSAFLVSSLAKSIIVVFGRAEPVCASTVAQVEIECHRKNGLRHSPTLRHMKALTTTEASQYKPAILHAEIPLARSTIEPRVYMRRLLPCLQLSRLSSWYVSFAQLRIWLAAEH